MLVKCPRCGGYGKIESFKHVDNGICFECYGAGEIEQEQAEKYIISEIKHDQKIAEKNAKLDAYRKECKEHIEKQREEWKNKKKVKPKPTVYQPYKYEGSAQEALDIFFNSFEE
jgi:hypothetical protein